jgi:hypothetical protein
MLGMTQEQLADALGITYQQVQNMRKAIPEYRQAVCNTRRLSSRFPSSFFFDAASAVTVKSDGAPEAIRRARTAQDGPARSALLR